MTLKELIKILMKREIISISRDGDGNYRLSSETEKDLIIAVDGKGNIRKIGSETENGIDWFYQI